MRIKALAAIASSLLAVACGVNRLKMNYGSADISTTPGSMWSLPDSPQGMACQMAYTRDFVPTALSSRTVPVGRYVSFPMT